MDCKSTMAKNSTGKNYSYLRCRLYLVDSRQEKCTSHSIRLEKLEEIVSERIKAHINLFCNSDKLGGRLAKEQLVEDKLQSLNKKIRKVDKELILRTEALKNIYIDKVNGLISQNQFNEFNSIFLKEKEGFSIKKEELEKIIYEFKQKNCSAEYYKGVVEKYKNFSRLTHSMINELIDCIEIGEKNKKTLEQEIIIYWNF